MWIRKEAGKDIMNYKRDWCNGSTAVVFYISASQVWLWSMLLLHPKPHDSVRFRDSALIEAMSILTSTIFD